MSEVAISTGTVGCVPLPACSDEARRERLRLSGRLNGIDYVEVGDSGKSLCIHLFGGVPAELGIANVRISGGDRITGLHAVSVKPEQEPELHDDVCLRVELDREGDHSPYCLCLVDASSGIDPSTWVAYPGFDPRYACATLYFRLDCAKESDCAALPPCVQPAAAQPEINYLAKDYASFRQLFLDRMALDVPAWQERHVPDIGIALIEALAYTADHLSYYQDAVATEAYLETARRRISVRRHARLVDYRMHEGCNARALVSLSLAAGEVTLPLDQLLLLTPPAGQGDAKAGMIDSVKLAAARVQGAQIFQPMALDGATSITVVAAQSAIRLHTWGNALCCLPRGSTQAVLVDAPPTNTKASVDRTRALKLKAGDLLIFEEVLGPATGSPADANPEHRHAVRLAGVQETVDPLDGTLLLQVSWDACDALPFDLCLSIRMAAPDCRWIGDVSLARGNVLLVDHGDHLSGQCKCDVICQPPADVDSDYPGLSKALAAMTDACQRCQALAEDCWLVPGTTQYGCCRCDGAVQDVLCPPGDTEHVLPGTPLTWAEPLPAQPGAPICKLLARDVRAALPQLRVYGGTLQDVLVNGIPAESLRWQARPDLLESGPDDRHFVVEIDDDGLAHLRFGDGVLGRQPQAGNFFRALPRIGNGPAGNVGRDSIIWLALASGTLSGVDIQPRNPLPASGGSAAESLAEVKLYAPGAFRANPLRAIVADDYAMFAARTPGVQDTACTMDWTGSWYEADVVVDPLGREDLPMAMAQSIDADLEHYRRMGHDVAVHAACYVPLLITMSVCVAPTFLTAHVKAALQDRFSAGLRRDGMPGFFHPDRLQLGMPIDESALIAEAQAVTGVVHVEVTRLMRADNGTSDRPPGGVLLLGKREIAQVDNDPDHPDHGGIQFTMGGGR
ncbi:putative baseplate assembly protein [Dyella choica]|uniref:Putative baseplate assembly protein n=1 Tax=Dyella choica TaxID=1927959 RepID=A0A3S0PKT4_9GAMM|nr:putative baseplate assembly protein [Dyella choica]RUL78923.1 putative baseplate assembly protein [Dyella choica]